VSHIVLGDVNRSLTETFPVPATSSDSTEWAGDRKQSNVDTLLVVFHAHGIAETAHQSAIERGADTHLCWESGHKFLTSDARWSIGETDQVSAWVAFVTFMDILAHQS
jgi:hypothetical protein